jgi:hypothetical protein
MSGMTAGSENLRYSKNYQGKSVCIISHTNQPMIEPIPLRFGSDGELLGPAVVLVAREKEKESIPFIFNDESTGSCICLRLDLYMSHVKITCTTADCFCFLCSPTLPQPAPTRAYVTRMKDNVSRSFEPRHVISDIRISSGLRPRCDITNVT